MSARRRATAGSRFVTVMIAGYILWQAFREIGGVIRLLMLGSPPELAAGDVIVGIRGVAGVGDVHHVHLWQIDEHAAALDAHLTIEPGRWGEADAVKTAVKELLRREFGIAHTTLEIERHDSACAETQLYGHA